MAEKPILFNMEMVKAILEGRKTQTRRIIKPVAMGMTYEDDSPARKPPYKAGDVLWVRETWKQETHDWAGGGYALTDGYLYRADEPQDTTGMMVEDRWHPSIHMPRRAARLFLRVKDVRHERLQNITPEDAAAEGIQYETDNSGQMRRWLFRRLWDDTIKKPDLPLYGWIANPWVWVIEFERIDGEPAGLWADRNTAQYADQDVLMPAT